MMSDVASTFPEGGFPGPRPPTSGVGADLRAARDALGWTLPAVSGLLRIRQPYLEAIEEGRLAELPGNAYAVGFVRAYATALGLDPDEIARRFRAEVAGVNRKTELTFPAPVPERGAPAGAVLLLGLAIATAGYVGWYHLSSERPGAEPVQQVPERLAALVEPTAPPPPAAAAIAPAAPALAEPTPGAPAPGAPTAAGAAPVAASAATPAPVAAAPAAVPAPPPADTPHLALRAHAEAWVQVRERGGQVLLNRVLRPGETWPVPDKPNLLLSVGNAGGLDLLVDGTVAPALGGEGVVRRDLLLDPELAKDGKLVPPAAPAQKPVATALRRPAIVPAAAAATPPRPVAPQPAPAPAHPAYVAPPDADLHG